MNLNVADAGRYLVPNTCTWTADGERAFPEQSWCPWLVITQWPVYRQPARGHCSSWDWAGG